MRRRKFIALLGGATTWPLTARAQQPNQVRRIGVLMALAEDDPDSRPRVEAFQQGLEKLVQEWRGPPMRSSPRW